MTVQSWEVSKDMEWGPWHSPSQSPVSHACLQSLTSLQSAKLSQRLAGWALGLAKVCNKAVGPGGRPLNIKSIWVVFGPGAWLCVWRGGGGGCPQV